VVAAPSAAMAPAGPVSISFTVAATCAALWGGGSGRWPWHGPPAPGALFGDFPARLSDAAIRPPAGVLLVEDLVAGPVGEANTSQKDFGVDGKPVEAFRDKRMWDTVSSRAAVERPNLHLLDGPAPHIVQERASSQASESARVSRSSVVAPAGESDSAAHAAATSAPQAPELGDAMSLRPSLGAGAVGFAMVLEGLGLLIACRVVRGRRRRSTPDAACAAGVGAADGTRCADKLDGGLRGGLAEHADDGMAERADARLAERADVEERIELPLPISDSSSSAASPPGGADGPGPQTPQPKAGVAAAIAEAAPAESAAEAAANFVEESMLEKLPTPARRKIAAAWGPPPGKRESPGLLRLASRARGGGGGAQKALFQ